jgi:hypothetical protein
MLRFTVVVLALIVTLAPSTLARAQSTAALTPAAPAAAPAPDPLQLSGFIQAQYVYNHASEDGVKADGKPENLNAFEIRRGRFKLTYAAEPVEAMLHVDATPTGVKLLDAEVGSKLAWHGDAYTRLAAGLFRIPFGWELQESMSRHPFPERSLWANRLFPGVRDVGARAWGAAWNEALIYQVAVQNGNPLSDASFPGLDPNGFKDVTARIGTRVGVLRAGVSGLIGEGYLAPEEDDAATTDVDEGHDPIDYSRWALGADIVLGIELPVLGELGLYGEAVYAKNLDRARAASLPALELDDADEPTGEVVSAEHLGFYLGALQNLGKLFALGARVDYFDHDVDASDDQLWAATFVLHAHPAKPLRLTAAYELRFEEPQADDDQLWLRAQVKY